MTRAVVYTRVSTLGQEDGTSLDTQAARCHEYASQQGWTVVAAFTDSHSGSDLSGRHGLGQARDAMRRGEADVLLVFALDRLARNQNHQGVLFYEAEEAGVRVESVTEDFNGPAGTLLRAVAAMVAEVEREKIRERTMRGKRERLEQGNAPTDQTGAYGYRKSDPLTSEQRAMGFRDRRIVVEEQAAVVREIYARIADGWSLSRVADDLNDRDVPSPAVGKIRFKDGRLPLWGASGVRQLVSNPAYRGLTVAHRQTRAPKRNAYTGAFNKKATVHRPEEEWTIVGEPGVLTPPIVSEELWQAANDHMNANTGARTRNEIRPVLLRDRLRCAVCDAPMYADPNGRPGRRCYYRCRYTRDRKSDRAYRPCPQMVSLLQEGIDAWVWASVVEAIADRERVKREIRRLVDERQPEDGTAEAERLDAEIVVLDRQIGRLLDLYARANDDLPWDNIESRMAALRAEKAAKLGRRRTIETRAKASVDMSPIDRLVRDVGPSIAGADFDTKVRVLDALGVRVRATRTLQTLQWSLPVVGEADTLFASPIDLTGAGEPDDEQRREQALFELAEEYGPDDGLSGRRPTCSSSGSPAASRWSASTSTSTGSRIAGGASRPGPRSRRRSRSTPRCRTTRRCGSTGCWSRSASISAPPPGRNARPAPCWTSARRSG